MKILIINSLNLFHGSKKCSCITQELIQIEYVEFMINKGTLNLNTINTRLNNLRVFLYFCMKNEFISEFKICLLNAGETCKLIYSNEELERLLKKPKTKKFSEYRNWVLVNYLLGTGNRLKTIRFIKVKDVNFENNQILLSRVKNKRQQIVPLSVQLSIILDEYIQMWNLKPDDFLFPNQFGSQLTKSGFQGAIRNYNIRRDVIHTSIHLFRHTFAKLYHKNGGDIVNLQHLLGHSNINITMLYLKLLGEEVADDYDILNPLSNFSSIGKKIKKLN